MARAAREGASHLVLSIAAGEAAADRLQHAQQLGRTVRRGGRREQRQRQRGHLLHVTAVDALIVPRVGSRVGHRAWLPVCGTARARAHVSGISSRAEALRGERVGGPRLRLQRSPR